MLKSTLVSTLMIFWFVCPVCVTLSQEPGVTPAASPPAMKFDCCCILLQSSSLLVVVGGGGWGGKGWEGWHGSSIFQRVKCASRVSHPELHAKSWRQLCTMSGAKARTCNRHMLGEGTNPKKNPKNNRFFKCIFFGHIPLQVRKRVSNSNLQSVDVHSGIQLLHQVKAQQERFFPSSPNNWWGCVRLTAYTCALKDKTVAIANEVTMLHWLHLVKGKTLQLFLMMENTLHFGGCFARRIHFLPPNLASLEKPGAAPSTAVILTD